MYFIMFSFMNTNSWELVTRLLFML